MQGQVTIGSDYFRKERDNYSNFGFAFFRELFQNSIDAGSKNINISMSHLSEDKPQILDNGNPQQGTLVQFQDDGCGMTTKILRDIYFCLGETTKTDTSTIGGYGKARILTCFSHFFYGIQTQDNVVDGYGSTYNLKNGMPWRSGCNVIIDVDERGRYGKEDIIQGLYDYLALSQMDIAVSIDIDGENLTHTMKLHRRRLARRLSFGSIYVNKSSNRQNSLVVRVNGVPMFTKMILTNALVILEIDQDKSRDVLVSNRDSLNSRYEVEFDQFLQELAVNTRSALRPSKPKTFILGDHNSACVTINRDMIQLNPSEDNTPISNEVASKSAYSITNPQPEINSLCTTQDVKKEVFDVTERYDSRHPAWVLHIEDETPITRKSVWLWDPNKNKNYGNTKRKTALLWSVSVQNAIKVWLKIKNQPSVSWLPGFVFSEDVEGMCTKRNRDIQHVMLCPITSKGKHRYSLNNANDRMRMIMLAAHEVAHFTYNYHDEQFDSLCFEITHRLMCEFRAISKEMNQVTKD